MFDWIKDAFSGVIEDTLNGWVESFMNWVLVMINEFVFKLPESKFATDVSNFLVWFTSTFAVVVALYKVIEYIINTQNGTQQYPLDEIFLRVGKSAVSMLVLPWIFKIIIMDFALPIANYFAASGTDFDGKGGYAVISAALTGSALGLSGGGIVVTALLIFFVISFIMFVFSTCVFYADFLVMQLLIAPVSLSMIADDNNYFSIWWRELLSMVVSLLLKLFLVTLVINILFTGGNIYLAIGAATLIIKSPSILKHMWYAGGGTKAMARGGGQLGSMGSRMLLSKLIK
ncbi:conjugal transfer protein TrbL family protein [Bacillus inaquosorum]|uniref:conjugal transfer protein TrbL family protein n=1 Tax=Bacillus inaquosorum TaxID=483913 RepID=UPI003D23D28A